MRVVAANDVEKGVTKWILIEVPVISQIFFFQTCLAVEIREK